MSISAPFVSEPMSVREEWIDHNGHLNLAYYHVLFDQGADQVFAELGLGLTYVETRKHTTYSAEYHVCYVRELHQGDQVRVRSQLLDFNDKSFRFYQEIWHEDGWLAATGEGLTLHIDMSGPRVVPIPADIIARLTEMKAAHDSLGWPERAGRQIAVRHKS